MTGRKCPIELLQYKSATQPQLNSSNADGYIISYMFLAFPDPKLLFGDDRLFGVDSDDYLRTLRSIYLIYVTDFVIPNEVRDLILIIIRGFSIRDFELKQY